MIKYIFVLLLLINCKILIINCAAINPNEENSETTTTEEINILEYLLRNKRSDLEAESLILGSDGQKLNIFDVDLPAIREAKRIQTDGNIRLNCFCRIQNHCSRRKSSCLKQFNRK